MRNPTLLSHTHATRAIAKRLALLAITRTEETLLCAAGTVLGALHVEAVVDPVGIVVQGILGTCPAAIRSKRNIAKTNDSQNRHSYCEFGRREDMP